jgi:hypothetical protein
MSHPDTCPISFTYPPVTSMRVVTLHSLSVYSDPPLPCHPPSYWLRLFSSQNFSRINTSTFSNLVIPKRVMRVPTPSPPWSARGESLSETEKAEALADTLETQFQLVTDPSVPAVIEMFDVALRSYFLTPSSEPKLTNPDEGSQGRQGSGPKRYTQQGLEASSPASGIPPGPDFQYDSPHPSLPYRVEARSVDLSP